MSCYYCDLYLCGHRPRQEAASTSWKRRLPHPRKKTTNAGTSEAFWVVSSNDEIARASNRQIQKTMNGSPKKLLGIIHPS